MFSSQTFFFSWGGGIIELSLSGETSEETGDAAGVTNVARATITTTAATTATATTTMLTDDVREGFAYHLQQ